MMTTPDVSGTRRGPLIARRRALVAGSVGNFIEWYEFGIYAYFATILAAVFFAPGGSSSGSVSSVEALIATYASFAIAFFFRPIGAAVFGRLGDRIGRKPTLVIVLVTMSAATAAIGLLPTYSAIGIAAPLLLTALRIVQGLSAGGEFGGAVAVMTEFAPVGRRGLFGAWQSFTVALGLLGGAATAALLATILSPEALEACGWRIGFLIAAPLGFVALWLRLRMTETPAFLGAQTLESGEQRESGGQADSAREAGQTTPSAQGSSGAAVPRAGARQTAVAIAVGIGRLMGWSAAGYTFLVVIPSYLQSTLGASVQEALVATVVANAGFALTILPAGWLSDRVGRRWVMLSGALLIAVLALPLLGMLQNPHADGLTKGVVVFLAGAAVGLLAGPGPAMLAEMFPTTVRYTGLGLAYALSNAVFSGSAGLIITSLIATTGDRNIPAYYVIAVCLVSAGALATLRGDAWRRPLR